MKRIAVLLLSISMLLACGGQEQSLETEIVVPVSVEEIRRKPIEEFIVTTETV